MYSYIIGESYINVINLTTGNNTIVMKDDPRFGDAVKAAKTKDFDNFEVRFSPKAAVQKFANQTKMVGGAFTIILENNQVFYSYKGASKVALNNAIVNRILDQAAAGFDVGPLCSFMANLLENPSATAIDELYLFIEACKLPITEDGYFVAYKIVRNDYMDIYTGTMRNHIGDIPEMPRFEVDTNRNNTCSAGLHFCSKSYLSAYGSNSRDSDRAMLVKINPAEVVSIPSDYNNAKGRAWRYEVIGEVPAGWRDTLPVTDYTTSPVVSAKGEEVELKVSLAGCDIYYGRFVFRQKTRRWHKQVDNAMVSRDYVAGDMNDSLETIKGLEK